MRKHKNKKFRMEQIFAPLPPQRKKGVRSVETAPQVPPHESPQIPPRKKPRLNKMFDDLLDSQVSTTSLFDSPLPTALESSPVVVGPLSTTSSCQETKVLSFDDIELPPLDAAPPLMSQLSIPSPFTPSPETNRTLPCAVDPNLETEYLSPNTCLTQVSPQVPPLDSSPLFVSQVSIPSPSTTPPAMKGSIQCAGDRNLKPEYPSPNTYLTQVPPQRLAKYLSQHHSSAVLQSPCVQREIMQTKRELRRGFRERRSSDAQKV